MRRASDTWSWRISLDGKDDYYFSDRHNVRSPAYALLNARIAYHGDGYTLSLWSRNLTDKTYYTRAFGSFGNDPKNGYAVEPYYQYGEPRVYGATFEVHL